MRDDRGEVLVPLAVRHQDDFGAGQRRADPLAVEAPHDRVRDDEAARADARARRAGAPRSVGQAVADQDGVAAGRGADIDTDGMHHGLAGGTSR